MFKTTFIIRSGDPKQNFWVEARGVKIQQMHGNFELYLVFKLLFIVTGKHYESGLVFLNNNNNKINNFKLKGAFSKVVLFWKCMVASVTVKGQEL